MIARFAAAVAAFLLAAPSLAMGQRVPMTPLVERTVAVNSPGSVAYDAVLAGKMMTTRPYLRADMTNRCTGGQLPVLLLALHGGAYGGPQNGATAWAGVTKFNEGRHCAVVIYPNATTCLLWKSGDSPDCQAARIRTNGGEWRLDEQEWPGVAPGTHSWSIAAGINDLGYLKAIIDQEKAKHSVAETIVTGASRGAMMTYTFACNAPLRVDRIVVAAGSVIDRDACNPLFARPLFDIHGLADDRVCWEGPNPANCGIYGYPTGKSGRDYYLAGAAPAMEKLGPWGHEWPTQVEHGWDATQATWNWLGR